MYDDQKNSCNKYNKMRTRYNFINLIEERNLVGRKDDYLVVIRLIRSVGEYNMLFYLGIFL